VQFKDLQLHPTLLETIAKQGYVEPTPIQSKAIPLVLAGRDLLACAQTGTGKTAAFALPLLQRMMAEPRRMPAGPRVLVLVPTRELASQVCESFATYGQGTGLRVTVVFGGVNQASQVRALRAGVDVLVAAPGRLLDLMQQRLVSLRAVETFVLDEADRMLDMGFIDPIRKVVAALPQVRQTLMLSATMPGSIRGLATQLLRNPEQVAVAPVASTVDTVEQDVYFVDQATKIDLLVHLLSTPSAERVLVFTRTKHGADRVFDRLYRARIEVEVIHGDKAQNARERALARFKDGSARVLVATDVAARGIDVDSVSHVINYDVPQEPEAYVHRIGRTARAGATGVALSFCDGSERPLLQDIERLINRELRVVREHPFSKRPRVVELNNYTPPPRRTIWSSRRFGQRNSRSYSR
jgi:ATP-dependent RNA helicase RhlE